jgi:hypothetical protein
VPKSNEATASPVRVLLVDARAVVHGADVVVSTQFEDVRFRSKPNDAEFSCNHSTAGPSSDSRIEHCGDPESWWP